MSIYRSYCTQFYIRFYIRFCKSDYNQGNCVSGLKSRRMNYSKTLNSCLCSHHRSFGVTGQL